LTGVRRVWTFITEVANMIAIGVLLSGIIAGGAVVVNCTQPIFICVIAIRASLRQSSNQYAAVVLCGETRRRYMQAEDCRVYTTVERVPGHVPGASRSEITVVGVVSPQIVTGGGVESANDTCR